MSVAIIYHHHERDVADDLVGPLRAAGYHVKMAPLGLEVGTDAWKRVVIEDLSTADVICLLLTQKSVADEWVAWRVERALERQTVRFIPICVSKELPDAREWVLPERVADFNRLILGAGTAKKELFLSVEYLLPPPEGEAPGYDVFLAHNSQDKSAVEQIAVTLRRRGINVWLDVEQVPPGMPFQDFIQKAINWSKSAAVFIGKNGMGKWQAMELRALITQCVEANRPVIPVLLPGVGELPNELLFLRELNYVRFTDNVNDHEAMNRLEWGITGTKPVA